MITKHIKLPRRIRRYLKNREGATALEFALLILPFSFLIFGIIELAILFFFNSTLNHATAEVSRQIRTGQFQSTCSNGEAEFKAAVCSYMAGLGDCDGRLRIEVKDGDNSFVGLADDPDADPEIDPDTGQPVIPPNVYATTQARDVVIVRAQYYHELAVPTAITGLATPPGNVHRIESAVAFRNEPFPDANCP